MATYVIGDIHGQYNQLKALLKKMNVTEEDDLYVLGDVVDRGEDSMKALQFLMSLPNCTCIVGNHEIMALSNLKLLRSEVTDDFIDNLSETDMGLLLDWFSNGGEVTMKEFACLSEEEQDDIIDFLGDFEAYVELNINGQDYLLVHAGIDDFDPIKPMEEYAIDDLVWIRPDYSTPYYEDIIVVSGHTPTQNIKENPRPGYIYKANNHIAIDCGAFASEGRLAGICLETGEEFYSRG